MHIICICYGEISTHHVCAEKTILAKVLKINKNQGNFIPY